MKGDFIIIFMFVLSLIRGYKSPLPNKANYKPQEVKYHPQWPVFWGHTYIMWEKQHSL